MEGWMIRYVALVLLAALCLFAPAAVAQQPTLTWDLGPALLKPGPSGSFDETEVKDPSLVYHDGQWHVFYTARGRDRYSIGYLSAP